MSTTVTTPAIVCPEWCAVAREQHVEELASSIADGDVLHKSAPAAWATVAVARQADGTKLPDDDEPSVLGYARDLLSLEDAEQAAQDYAAAAALLRLIVGA